jgi:hypothetical protein
MSDASDAFASPVVRDGIEWPRLTMRDYGVLEQAVREHLQAVTREMLDECEITGKERLDQLRQSLSMPVTVAHVDVALQTERFVRKALEMSLKKAGKTGADAAALIDALDPYSASELARILIGFLELRPFSPANRQGGTGSPPASDATSPAPTPEH